MNADSTEMTAALRDRLAAAPLEAFALALYARPGIEAACLRLQDEAGIDVCELLWRCWLLQHGVVPGDSTEEALAEVHGWQREVTAPLRRLRRALKGQAPGRPGVEKLRATLKQAELQAELEALARLESLARQGPLRPLLRSRERAAECLARDLQLQKKSHLSTLQTVIACLDPPPGPR